MQRRNRITTVLNLGFMALAMTAAGCCPTTPTTDPACPPPRRARPAKPARADACGPITRAGDCSHLTQAGQSQLLGETSRVYAPPVEGQARPAPRGEVNGELVYNLGQNMIANSCSVVLVGETRPPTAMRVAGGVEGCCPNKPPERYYQAVRANQVPPRAPAAPAPAPAAAVSVAPLPGQARVEGTASLVANPPPAGICPVLTDSLGLCLPGDGLGACYTLPEGAGAPELYVPSAAPAPIAALPTSGAADKYCPTPAEGIPPPPVDVAKAPAAPMQPAPQASAPAGKAESFPPVPQVTDMDAAVDALLTRDGAKAANLPEVQLPPKLN